MLGNEGEKNPKFCCQPPAPGRSQQRLCQAPSAVCLQPLMTALINCREVTPALLPPLRSPLGSGVTLAALLGGLCSGKG